MQWSLRRTVGIGAAIALTILAGACTRQVDTMSPQALQEHYGITNASSGLVATPAGAIKGTIIPVTLPNGRSAELIVPDNNNDYHAAYLRDDEGVHPIALQDGVTRDQLVSAPPRVVSRQAERAHAKQHTWEKDLLLIGGGAAGGAGIGAIAGGKKGAAIGAGAGGVGGLVYDLMSRKKR